MITIAPPVDEADVMSEKSFSSSSGKEKVNILWFRNGLRLHDNGALMKAAEDKSCKLLPLFIFDGETPTTRLVFSDNDFDVHWFIKYLDKVHTTETFSRRLADPIRAG